MSASERASTSNKLQFNEFPHNLLSPIYHGDSKPIFITEAILDAESLTQATGYLAISFLSALFQPQLLYWLFSIGTDFIFAMDNDVAGDRCFSKYRELFTQFTTSLRQSLDYLINTVPSVQPITAGVNPLSTITGTEALALKSHLDSIHFSRMSFPCKDINECLKNFGPEFLKSQCDLYIRH